MQTSQNCIGKLRRGLNFEMDAWRLVVVELHSQAG